MIIRKIFRSYIVKLQVDYWKRCSLIKFEWWNSREKRSSKRKEKIKKKEESRDKETKQENKDRRKWLSWIWHLRFIVLRSTLRRSLEYRVEKDKNVDISFIFASKSTFAIIISPISYSKAKTLFYIDSTTSLEDWCFVSTNKSDPFFFCPRIRFEENGNIPLRVF